MSFSLSARPRSKRPGVLLLGAHENEALPILARLHDHRVPVTVAVPHRISLGFFSRYPKARLLCPHPDTFPDAFTRWLEITVRTGRYPVTLVCGEQATWLVAKAKERLLPHTRIPVVDPDTFMLCRDKSLTMKAAARLGVPVPATYFPEEEGIEAVANAVPTYPVVLKPNTSNGARGISYPKAPAELVAAYARTRSRYGPCIVQEFIPPGGVQFKAEVLLDPHQRVLAGGVYDKPRFYPPTGGSSTLNSTVDRPDILDCAIKFLKGIGWWGMGDCDFITDPRDNLPKLMEVNPRFTRSIKMLVWAGLDFPYLLYQMALGESVEPQFEYRKGLYLRYLFSDCVWFLRSPERFKTKPSFFWFFSPRLKEEIFSLSDPGPWLAYCLNMVVGILDPRKRKFMLRTQA